MSHTELEKIIEALKTEAAKMKPAKNTKIVLNIPGGCDSVEKLKNKIKADLTQTF